MAATILRSENELQAAASYLAGSLWDPDLTIGKQSVLDIDCPLQHYITTNFSAITNIFADTIEFKGTCYSIFNYHSILMTGEDDFEVGIIKKIVICSKEAKYKITIIFQKATKTYLPQLGLYQVLPCDEISHICISKLANYYPVYLYSIKKSYNFPELYLTLRTSPLII